jgi:hypothetical protein
MLPSVITPSMEKMPMGSQPESDQRFAEMESRVRDGLRMPASSSWEEMEAEFRRQAAAGEIDNQVATELSGDFEEYFAAHPKK